MKLRVTLDKVTTIPHEEISEWTAWSVIRSNGQLSIKQTDRVVITNDFITIKYNQCV